MISAPQDSTAYLASAWTAGIAVLFLGIGLQGATSPLLPDQGPMVVQMDMGDQVMVEEFEPPSSAPDEVVPETSTEVAEIEDVEIPPLPVIETPISPPEMVELAPLEPVIEKPPAPPTSKPPNPKPKPVNPTTPSKPKPKPASAPGSGGNGTGSGTPTVFAGGGRGRFPSPSYPTSARLAKQQGSVRLLVVVEASGLPSSVSVSSSSGFASLDEAARDQVSRRWRWPAGEVRHHIVPIRFVLQ